MVGVMLCIMDQQSRRISAVAAIIEMSRMGGKSTWTTGKGGKSSNRQLIRQIHSEPATISSIQADLRSNFSSSSPSSSSSTTKDHHITFDLPNIINTQTPTKNVYKPKQTSSSTQYTNHHRTTTSNRKMYDGDDDDGIESMRRSASAQSLPATSSDGITTMSPYQRTLYMLANDPTFQKEVALGKRIGFYRLGKELGAGNFSKVKLGVHVLTKEKVAVKVMEKSKMDQKAQKLLEREIKSMEDLHHPNIIRLFECVETISRTFLVMEYAGGGELYAYVQERGKLGEDDAKPLFAQIVAAVSHMHKRNIVHRDIKPENVIFSHPGWIKLADFGFSCQSSADAKLSTFCGSPPYAAPELFRDKEYSGPAVDIWALGVLLYFLLVGVTPFRGETFNDLSQNILKGSYTMPEYLSTFAQHTISRMLQSDVTKRVDITDVKKTYWLTESKFPKSYTQCSRVPNEEELANSPIAQSVWKTLQQYGIDERMMKDAANKGARNAIIGTYRIVLYQSQSKDDDKQRNRIKDHQLLQQATKYRSEQAILNSRSRTCTIL